MWVAARAIALCLCAGACGAVASEAPFTGAFMGGGRGCYGGLYVRTKTVEWNTPFNRCKRTRYDLLEATPAQGPQSITMQLKGRDKSCPFEVISVDYQDETRWIARGYQSMEAYRKREHPNWKNSAIERRKVLSCLVYRLQG